jgi:hypothetical protein
MAHAWLAAMLVLAVSAPGAEWHVAPEGDDAGAGTAEAPLRTLAEACRRVQPGDTCIVAPGRYRETLRPASGGTAGAPISFIAKAGAIISGLDPAAGPWTPEDDGPVLSASCAGPVEQVFWNGRMLRLARFPNTDGDPMDLAWSEAGADTKAGEIIVADDSLPANLAGARIHVLPGHFWVSWTRPVTGWDPDTRTLSFPCDWDQHPAYGVTPGTRWYVYGTRSLLDAPGEWWHDAETGRLLVWPPDDADPAAAVEVKRRDAAVDLRGLAHVSVKGFNLFGATARLDDAEHCRLENCSVAHPSHLTEAEGWGKQNETGIVVSGRDNLVQGCRVVWSAGNGVTLLGENNTVDRCEITHCDYIAMDCANVWMEGRGNTLSRSTLAYSGRSNVVHRYLKAGKIIYNDIHDAGMLTADLGATYCFGTDGEGTEIAYNWVHDITQKYTGSGVYVGIYIDNGSSNFLIHHNVCWNISDTGLRLNIPSHNNRVYHNAVFNSGSCVNLWGPDDSVDMTGCDLRNNLFAGDLSLPSDERTPPVVVIGDGLEYGYNYEGTDPGMTDPLNGDFTLEEDSPCVDAGVVIEGISDGFTGKAPDLGAYERGREPWRPGHADPREDSR